MKLNNTLIRPRFEVALSLILLTYLLIGLLLLKNYQYQLNGDGIAYIKIALQYLAGPWYNAVDAYHSPMISWILVPFLYFNSSPVYALWAAKIMSLFVGFFTILGVGLLSSRFSLDRRIRILVLILMIPLTLYFAFSVLTPDLLMVMFLVYYFYFIFDPNYSNKIYGALACGLLGALAFFTKSYAFPFIIVHFLVFNLFHYLKDRTKGKFTLRNLLVGFFVLFLVSGIWIGLISDKEGFVTYGTAGEFNYNLVGPESKGWVTPYLGEEPALIKNWSPFDSIANFKHQLRLIMGNSLQIISILTTFSYFSILIILVYIILIIVPLKQVFSRYEILFPLSTLLIYLGGYTPVLVEERYLWVGFVLLLLMGAYLITLLFKSSFFQENRAHLVNYQSLQKLLIVALFAFSFIILPVTYLDQNINPDKDVYLISQKMTVIPENSNFASNDEWLKSSYLTFYWKGEFLGQTKPDMSSEEILAILKEKEVNYYLVWGEGQTGIDGLTEITGGIIRGLRIYRIES